MFDEVDEKDNDKDQRVMRKRCYRNKTKEEDNNSITRHKLKQ